MRMAKLGEKKKTEREEETSSAREVGKMKRGEGRMMKEVQRLIVIVTMLAGLDSVHASSPSHKELRYIKNSKNSIKLSTNPKNYRALRTSKRGN